MGGSFLLKTCRLLKIGEDRLGKRPPSLRHGQNKKCTWYHPECAMVAFAACSKKSRVVNVLRILTMGSSRSRRRISNALERPSRIDPIDKISLW